jgi:hypothetical protein
MYNGHTHDEFVPEKTAAYISQNDLHVGEMQFVKHLISLLNVKALVPDMVSSKSFLTKIFVTTILPKCELMGANSRTSVLFLPPQEEIEKSN